MADLDGINNTITKKAILSCWDNDIWDVCTANQVNCYHDIWALRHSVWCPGDCWSQQKFLRQHGVGRTLSLLTIYLKQINIPVESEWLEVDSAFGGLAIYRKEVLQHDNYVIIDENDIDVCEHISLHSRLRERGFRIFINPKMINARLHGLHAGRLKYTFVPAVELIVKFFVLKIKSIVYNTGCLIGYLVKKLRFFV